MRRVIPTCLIAVLIGASTATGCGQKGELYLPPDQPPPAAQDDDQPEDEDGDSRSRS